MAVAGVEPAATAQADMGKVARGLLAEVMVLLEELAAKIEQEFPSSGL
jgi:hypothetical protein